MFNKIYSVNNSYIAPETIYLPGPIFWCSNKHMGQVQKIEKLRTSKSRNSVQE